MKRKMKGFYQNQARAGILSCAKNDQRRRKDILAMLFERQIGNNTQAGSNKETLEDPFQNQWGRRLLTRRWATSAREY